MVTPVILEIGAELIPYVDSEKDGGKFLFKDIPAMRERTQSALGMKMPGVRARGLYSGPANSTAFQIQVDEVIVRVGHAYPSMKFCPASCEKLDSLGIPLSPLKPASGLPGASGAWVPSDQWEALVRNGLELWTVPEFLIAQLEAVLLQNAAVLLGVQEVEAMLSDWQSKEGGMPLIQEALPGARPRLRFARLLRALVSEQVPVSSWQDILDVVRQTGVDDREKALREIRLRLKAALTGGVRVKPLIVPMVWEDWVVRDNGRVRFMATAADTHALIVQVRAWMKTPDPPNVLVTQSWELRRFVRRLIETEFPRLRVLTQDELPVAGTAAAGHDLPATLESGARTNA
jgi:type III secretory pathway component EscV